MRPGVQAFRETETCCKRQKRMAYALERGYDGNNTSGGPRTAGSAHNSSTRVSELRISKACLACPERCNGRLEIDRLYPLASVSRTFSRS
jgi:hypothetical protein